MCTYLSTVTFQRIGSASVKQQCGFSGCKLLCRRLKTEFFDEKFGFRTCTAGGGGFPERCAPGPPPVLGRQRGWFSTSRGPEGTPGSSEKEVHPLFPSAKVISSALPRVVDRRRLSRFVRCLSVFSRFKEDMPDTTELQYKPYLIASGMDDIVTETYQQIVEVLTECEEPSLLEVSKWFKKAMDHNVPHGKRNRLMAVVMSYQFLVQPSDLTPKSLNVTCILGWCVEMLQSYFLICDDIMDQSITRRGRPCWYKVDGVGMMAINDAVFIESAIYQLIKKYCQDLPCYVHLLELFHEATLNTIKGQCLDMLSSPENDKPDLSKFSEERHASIVKYKTSFYSFILPVRIGMYLAGWCDSKSHKEAEAILLKIGHVFQVQDDALDCYGEPEIIGKIGTDIVDGKCSWLVVKALQMADKNQRRILENHYGQGVPEGDEEKAVKAVYKDLNLKDFFLQYEEAQFEAITQDINKLKSTSQLPVSIFHGIVKKLYRRQK